jgi:hypothetical protein
VDHVARGAAVTDDLRAGAGERVDRGRVGRVADGDVAAEQVRGDRQRLLRPGRDDDALGIDRGAARGEPGGDPAP